MKSLIQILLVVLIGMNTAVRAQAKPPKAKAKNMQIVEGLPQARKQWKASSLHDSYIHFERAFKQAQTLRKRILIVCTQSDEVEGHNMQRNIWTTREFQRVVKQSFILLYLDRTKGDSMPEDQRRHNQMVRDKFGITEPIYTCILEQNGEVLGGFGGLMSKGEYLEHLAAFEMEKKPLKPAPVIHPSVVKPQVKQDAPVKGPQKIILK